MDENSAEYTSINLEDFNPRLHVPTQKDAPYDRSLEKDQRRERIDTTSKDKGYSERFEKRREEQRREFQKEIDEGMTVFETQYDSTALLYDQIEIGDVQHRVEEFIDPGDTDSLQWKLRELYPDLERQSIDSERQQSIDHIIHMGGVINALTQHIRQNPDLPQSELMKFVDSSFDGLDPEIREHFEFAVAKYCENHSKVEAYTALYPAPADLFAKVFNYVPIGRIEVVKGPMTLTFRCQDDDDYIVAHSFWTCLGDRTKVTEAQESEALLSAGFAIEDVAIPDMTGIVCVERAGDVSERYLQRVEEHEEQHHINTLFVPLERIMTMEDIVARVMQGERTIEKRGELLSLHFARYLRRKVGIDSRARSEILAHAREKKPFNKILKTMRRSPLYDYAAIYESVILESKDRLKLEFQGSSNYFEEEYPEFQSIIDSINPKDLVRITQMVFDKEYKRDLKKWITAATVVKREMGKDAFAILYAFPINQWPKVARRLTTQKVSKDQQS